MNDYEEMKRMIGKILGDLDRYIASDRFDAAIYEGIKAAVETISGEDVILGPDLFGEYETHQLRQRYPYDF